jgi:Bacterial Ig-like domain (group 3)/FG-GAP-like repeat/FG-GAP repeat
MNRASKFACGIVLLSGSLSASTTTTTTLTSVTPLAPEYGQTITMVATVTPSTASGSVSFVDRGVLVGSAKLNASGVAQATTLTLAAGPHSLVAIYGGSTSGGYLASQSAALPYIVTAGAGASFGTAVSYAAGTMPFAVAVGDFNGDGKADLAAANNNSGNVSVLLGNGNGTFQTAVNYPVGTNPRFVAVADFNGDGKPDLAVANWGTSNVSILLGNGDGTFQTMTNYATGPQPPSLAVADFNLDGFADLVVADSDSNSVSVLLGKGDGTFQPKVDYTAGGGAISVAVWDFNGDGFPDVAAANYAGNVSVLLGTGTGAFQPAANYPAVSIGASVAVSDFNDDGKADLAVSNQGGSFSILLGNGDGTFQAAVNHTSTSYFAAVGDFNGDGKSDLVEANYGINSVGVLLGNGNATFQTVTNYPVGTQPIFVAVGDFNGDGIQDLAAADEGGGVSVLLGSGVAAIPSTSITLVSSASPITYGQPVTLTATVVPSSAPGTVEFLDGGTLIATKALTSGQAQITTSLLPSGANALHAKYVGVAGVWQASLSNTVQQQVNAVAAFGFVPQVTYAAGSEPDSVAVADFNLDGKADLAVADALGGVDILLGNGNGTFQPPLIYGAGALPVAVAVGDFNGDGKPDFAEADSEGFEVWVQLGNGDGTFQTAVGYATGAGPFSVAVGDFNGDGKPDLVVAYVGLVGPGGVSLLLGNGDGTFQPAVNFATGTNPHSVAVADFNGDGFADLATAGGLAVMLGNGNGTFQAAVPYAAGPSPYFVTVGDFNKDGKPDLAVADNISSGTGSVSVLLGNGDGTFQTAVSYPVGTNPTSAAVADFNGDGKPDLAVSNGGSGNLSLMLGNGDGSFQAAVNYVTGTGPKSVAAGDFNGDGRTDLAVANEGSNNVSILLGNATALQFYPVTPCRVADTRLGQGFTGPFGPPSLAADVSRPFPILASACSIPASAEAYSLNLTVVPTEPLGFLSAWPTGEAYPGVSTLNSSDGSTIANAATIVAGISGSITALASNPTDLIIDINGYYAPAVPSGLEFFPLTPCRVADTRTSQPFTGGFGPPSLIANASRDFLIAASPCVPGSGAAFSLNMTVVPDGTLGFLSTWPAGQPFPSVSTLNSPDGTTLANAAIVPAGTSGGIDVLASNNTDLIIDINGKFAAPVPGGLQFYPVTPCRVADTRSSQPFTNQFGPPSLLENVARNFPIQSSPCGIPVTAEAFALNMTAVPQGTLGFLSAWPTGQPYPGVSTLNSTDGYVIANAAIVPAGTGGGITVLASNPTDLIIDVVGYFAP